MADAQFQRQRALVTRLVAQFGETVAFSTTPIDPASPQPWNPDDGAPETHSAKVVWYTQGGNGLAQTLRTLTGSNIADGTKFCILTGDCGFTPVLQMQITAADGTFSVTAIDRIAPSGVPVAYLITVS